MFDRIAEKVPGTAGQKIHPREVERVIGALLVSSEFWRVVTLSRLPAETTAEIIKALNDAAARRTLPPIRHFSYRPGSPDFLEPWVSLSGGPG